MGQARRRARPLRRRTREDIRERLLECRARRVRREGLRRLLRRAPSRERADAHQPQIHYHFASKEALWNAAVDHLFAELAARDGRARLRSARPASVDALADGFAELIRRFVRFAAAHPELNQIMVHEATASSARLRWMTERHVRPLYDVVRALWRRLREAGIAAPIDEAVLHYVLVGAASLPYVNAPEARLLTGVEPTDPAFVEAHATGLVATLLPNRSSLRAR